MEQIPLTRCDCLSVQVQQNFKKGYPEDVGGPKAGYLVTTDRTLIAWKCLFPKLEHQNLVSAIIMMERIRECVPGTPKNVDYSERIVKELQRDPSKHVPYGSPGVRAKP